MTDDQILALLRANPEAALAALGELRIAGRWEAFHSDEYDCDVFTRRTKHPAARDDSDKKAAAVSWNRRRPEDGWMLTFKGQGPVLRFDSREEAQAAADAHLVAEGWTLLPKEGE